MNNKILVPLKRHDRVEEIVPYIEQVAQPGERVVFLVRHPVSGLKWLQAYCGIAQCGLEKSLTVRRMIESYSVQKRRQLAQRKVFHTCETLHETGAKVAVEVYTGSLRKAVRGLVHDRDGQLMVMRPGMWERVMSLLRGTVPIWSMLNRPSYSSVLLFHPGG